MSQEQSIPPTSQPVSEAARSATPSTLEQTDQDAKPKQEQEYLQGLQLFFVVSALLFAVLLMAIDVSIVSTALPRITDTFHTIADQGWYAAGFTFANSALQPMSGKIYTFFPMKISFMAFLAVFELGSLLCATSTSSAMFIVGRVVAGLGASGIVSGALSIMAMVRSPESGPMYMGLIMSVASMGQIVGPLIGGGLTQAASWRWCFYLNVPCGALTFFFLALIKFPNNSSSRRKFAKASIIKDFDIVGFAIFVPAIVMCLMALQWGGVRYAWSSSTIIGLLAGFGASLVPLCWWEYRQGANAMFPLPLLRRRIIYCACLTSFLSGGTLLIVLYYLPLWFQTVKLVDPLQSGVNTLASFLTQIVFAVLIGFLCPRVIPYLTPFAIFGNMINAAGTGVMTSFKPSTSMGVWVGVQILSGAGRGVSMQIPIQTVQRNVEKKEIAMVTAVVSFFQFFGSAFFSTLGQTAFQNLLKSALRQYTPGLDPETVVDSGATDIRHQVPPEYLNGVIRSYNSAIRHTMYLAFAAAIVATLTSFGLGWKKVERKARPAKDKQEESVEEGKAAANVMSEEQ